MLENGWTPSTLRMFLKLESLGMNNNNSSVQEDFDREILFKDGQYQVALPWKESHDALPDNYHSVRSNFSVCSID